MQPLARQFGIPYSLLLVALFLTGCFRSIDYSGMICEKEHPCPSGYQCRYLESEGVEKGFCCQGTSCEALADARKSSGLPVSDTLDARKDGHQEGMPWDASNSDMLQSMGGGSNAGGTTNVGGSTSLGGSTTAGGTAGAGGTATTGGSTANGGSTQAGGATGSGGTARTGGAVVTGGSLETGGAIATGGNLGTGGVGTGGVTTVGETDAMAILNMFKPTGTKLIGYNTWLEEIGTATVVTETVTDGNIKMPLLIPPGVTYDGKGQSIKPSIPKCDGSQTASRPPVFILAPGASLKNVMITPPGCDGVHLMGDNTLENIRWPDVEEYAASSRSYFPGGRITIKGGSAKLAENSVFQFNTPVQVTIQDFTATNISKMVRQNGGTSFSMSVDLINVKVSGCEEAVVRSDTSNCKVTQKDVTADCPIHLITGV